MGASGAGGGTPGRGEASTDSADAKIKGAKHVVAGVSFNTAAIVHGSTVYLDRAVRRQGSGKFVRAGGAGKRVRYGRSGVVH